MLITNLILFFRSDLCVSHIVGIWNSIRLRVWFLISTRAPKIYQNQFINITRKKVILSWLTIRQGLSESLSYDLPWPSVHTIWGLEKFFFRILGILRVLLGTYVYEKLFGEQLMKDLVKSYNNICNKPVFIIWLREYFEPKFNIIPNHMISQAKL